MREIWTNRMEELFEEIKDEMINEVEITISKKGIPCISECGGAWTSSGEARLVADQYGSPKHAIFIVEHGDRCNVDHAYIPVRENDIVATGTWHKYRGYAHKIWRIQYIDMEEKRAYLVRIIDERPFEDVISSVEEKAGDYHCKTPSYISNYAEERARRELEIEREEYIWDEYIESEENLFNCEIKDLE